MKSFFVLLPFMVAYIFLKGLLMINKFFYVIYLLWQKVWGR